MMDPDDPDPPCPVLSVTPPVLPAVREEPVRRSRFPVFTGALPPDRIMAPLVPADPPAAWPVAMVTAPDEPLPVVPELNTMVPEAPDVTALAVRRVTGPDDPTLVLPLTTLTTPPEVPEEVAMPAWKMRLPPAVVSVVPTTTEMAPAAPPDAVPVATVICPDATVAVPVLNTNEPLLPPRIALLDRTTTSPLAPVFPYPLIR